MNRPEPPNGAIVLIGEAPDETVYVRDDDFADTGTPAYRWFALTGEKAGSISIGRTWEDVCKADHGPFRLFNGVELWISLHQHLQDAHSASDNPDFDAGLKFAAALVADTLGVARPPWSP